MISKLLIANRGEIACRIVATARRMGIETVAVYSEPDAGARHVEMADEAAALGGATPAESYLNGARIIEAALSFGADAIHPGYGFLSEAPDFADAVEAAGLTVIGPSAAAMRTMGLKGAAKAAMEAAGVPVVPGDHGERQDELHLSAAADVIGYPVLIKAVAGGGGKGMRLVEEASDFAEALASARNEARAAFGNDAVLVEKYIRAPRHIEIQVFGDSHGNVVHLYERDCSLQRRHQKVIEEAPAPGMSPEMRAAMGEAAVRAATSIGYVGAGTVEFIVDGSDGLRPDRFWFMEMNTRLQVEHPVTEEITDVDLVEWQIRVASGEALPLMQSDIPLKGYAVEARLYAENPAAGFLPASGRIHALDWPDGVRVETGVRAGDEITTYYDPMIAKLIATGPTRDAAHAALARALDKTVIAGTPTNLGFLSSLLRFPAVQQGAVETGLIAREQAHLVAEPDRPPSVLALAALAAGDLLSPGPDAGFTLWAPLRRTVAFYEGEACHAVALEVMSPSEIQATVGEFRIQCTRVGARWRIDGEILDTRVTPIRGGFVVSAAGGSWTFRHEDPLDRDSAAGADDAVVVAPMPGLLRDVAVAVGDLVEEGQRLAVLEAMKMEHVLRSSRAARVAEVFQTAGSQVAAGDALVRLEDDA